MLWENLSLAACTRRRPERDRNERSFEERRDAKATPEWKKALHNAYLRVESHVFVVLLGRLLVCLVSLTIVWSFCFGIYFMITFDSQKQCMVCEETDAEFSRFAPLVWYSDWAFVTCAITWFVWVWRKVFKNSSAQEDSSSLCLIELSLPLSIFAMIGYTVYLGTSNWGDDFVNKEACHSLTDTATPKQGTEDEPSISVMFYLASSKITGYCVHYVCPISIAVLYFKHYVRKAPWKPLRPIGVVTFLSLIVVLAQEVGGVVIYCTENIYLTALYAILSCTIFHALFFFRRSGDSDKDTDKEEGGDIEEATHSSSTEDVSQPSWLRSWQLNFITSSGF